MDELKPSEKFVGTLRVQAGFHHYELDRTRVPTAEAPSLASAIGFQDRVAKQSRIKDRATRAAASFSISRIVSIGHSVSPTGVGVSPLATNRIHTGVSVVDVEHQRCGKQRINVWKIAS